MSFSSTVAIAALSTRVLSTGDAARPRAAALAALQVTAAGDALAFTFHTHVPRSAARLGAWLDARLSGDPLVVGYRLQRISRLLVASGCDRRRVHGLGLGSGHDISRFQPGRSTPLSVIAVLHGVQAVDEEALMHALPVRSDVAANAALINAVASWVVFVRHSAESRSNAGTRDVALAQLGRSLTTRTAPAPLAAAMMGTFQ